MWSANAHRPGHSSSRATRPTPSPSPSPSHGGPALEERGDAEIQIAEAGGDAIAAEFERYLRRRGRGPGPTGM